VADATWYRPVCDVVLAKIERWHKMYERGDESADRDYVTMNARVVKVVTMYAHRLRFKKNELDHLVRIMDALCEHKQLVADFMKVRDGLIRGRLVPGGEHEVVLNFYKQDIEEILDALRRAKTGKLKTMEQVAKEQADAGKGMFEE
jgi:precorrin isomerase